MPGITLDAVTSPDVGLPGPRRGGHPGAGHRHDRRPRRAGSAALNNIDDTIQAYIEKQHWDQQRPGERRRGLGDRDRQLDRRGRRRWVRDRPELRRERRAGSAGLLVGASVTRNNIGTNGDESVEAYTPTTPRSPRQKGGITVQATSTANVSSFALGGSVAFSRSEGLSLAVGGCRRPAHTTRSRAASGEHPGRQYSHDKRGRRQPHGHRQFTDRGRRRRRCHRHRPQQGDRRLLSGSIGAAVANNFAEQRGHRDHVRLDRGLPAAASR